MSLSFLGKTARIQKKEGFVRTPPIRYGPSSSLSKRNNTITVFFFTRLFPLPFVHLRSVLHPLQEMRLNNENRDMF